MMRARIALALVALAAGIAVAFAVAHEGKENVLDAALGVAVGWSFVASGLVAWARRPQNPIGRVMVLAGLLRLAAEFSTSSGQQVLGPIGHLMHDGFWIAVVYVLLAFPNGRVDHGLKRWLLAGAVLMLPLDLAWFLLGGDRVANDFTRKWGDPSNGLALWDAPEAARALQRVETGLVLLLMPLVIVAVARTWRRATPRFRVAIAPVLWTGAAGFAFMLLALADDNVGNPLGDIPVVLLDITLAGVAVGFLVGVLRARLARSAVAELVVELGRTTAPGDLRDALARALRDPSLALAYWPPDGGRYVDVDGRPVELQTESETSAVSVVEREGARSPRSSTTRRSARSRSSSSRSAPRPRWRSRTNGFRPS